ncbi:MAG: MOSC N-terminal beta barrel domain-containing protein [Aquificota bacterium]|nr:MOSC N-terminal beta barrel domain-containing protein [Aquificota bacterium]
MKVPRVSRILLYPFKGLDPVEVNEAKVLRSGSLEHDREFFLVDGNGKVVSGKRERKIHRVRCKADLKEETFTFLWEGREETFPFEDLAGMGEFFSEVLGYRVRVRREPLGTPDDSRARGPTLVSRSTLLEVGRWFGLTEREVRLRFRANLEVDGVPPFWEDSLAGRSFRVGEVLMIGTGVSRRCTVPTRDPFTGEELKGFVRTFTEMRKKTLPTWSPREVFRDTFYRLCLNTRVPEEEAGKVLKVGDEVLVA